MSQALEGQAGHGGQQQRPGDDEHHRMPGDGAADTCEHGSFLGLVGLVLGERAGPGVGANPGSSTADFVVPSEPSALGDELRFHGGSFPGRGRLGRRMVTGPPVVHAAGTENYKALLGGSRLLGGLRVSIRGDSGLQ
mgnify:CR=1 FL=1